MLMFVDLGLAVCTQSVPLLGLRKVFSEKENLLYCILCKASLCLFPAQVFLPLHAQEILDT